MSLATLAQKQAAKAFKIKGVSAPATITRTVPGAYDPTTGGTTSSTTTAPTKAILDATSLKTLGFKFGDGLVQDGDFSVLIPALGLPFVPGLGDDFAITSGDMAGAYTVKGVQPTMVGPLAVTYALLVRR